MTPVELKEYLARRKELVDAELRLRLPRLAPELAVLEEAMGYSLMAGGKRLRPILCMAGAELAGAAPESVLATACGLEFIHTYSLIHDDLPAMDDDDLRRGLPTCHKKYGEAVALLAGDGLLTEAFGLIAAQARTHPAEAVVRVVALIARAVGASGMVGGQVADLGAEGRSGLKLPEIEFIHRRKTGALITVSLTSGAVLGGAGEGDLARIEDFGRKIGAAFQIADDLLDIEGETEVLGKPVGSDQARGKATYPAVAGLEEARKKAKDLIDDGLSSLKSFPGEAEPLRALAGYIITRNN